MWVNEGYQRFRPTSGFRPWTSSGSHGGRRSSPTPRCAPLETSQPVLIDLLTNKAEHLRRQPHPAARRCRPRDRRHRHRAVRPPRDHAAAPHQQVCAAAARPGRCPARAGQPTAAAWPVAGMASAGQIHLCQFHRVEPRGGWVKRQGAACCAVHQPVLLLGETGTGKAAGARHSSASPRQRSVSSASTSPPCPTRCSKPSSLAWRGRRHRR